MPKLALSTFLILSLLFITSCKSNVKPDDLYGKWKYIKVESPHTSPPTSVPDEDLKQQAPYIEFKGNVLQIIWDGKLLSHGTFTVDGSNIHFKEALPGGAVREFPFFISQFDGKSMIFETLNKEDGTRVTAVKE